MAYFPRQLHSHIFNIVIISIFPRQLFRRRLFINIRSSQPRPVYKIASPSYFVRMKFLSESLFFFYKKLLLCRTDSLSTTIITSSNRGLFPTSYSYFVTRDYLKRDFGWFRVSLLGKNQSNKLFSLRRLDE